MRLILTTLLLLIIMGANAAKGAGFQAESARDTRLITPTTQGVFQLPETGIILEIAYATVNNPTRLIVTDLGAAGYRIEAFDQSGAALTRFEMPLIAIGPCDDSPCARLVGWPQDIAPTLPDALAAPWLIVFDAHGLYALPTSGPMPEAVIYLGPLEHFTPDLIETGWSLRGTTYTAAPPVERSVIKTAPDGTITALPTAARHEHYRDRFIPEDLRNPGGFMLLGWARAAALPNVARALRGTIPDDPDLPAPGERNAPIDLILPFDCATDWAISWGYHHSTSQNRFAVDFAPIDSGPDQAVYAAHAGTLYLKRYGTPDHLIDIGLAARVVAEDGITSTVYGHLDVSGTLALWDRSLPDFTWVEVGPVAQGQVIGVMGRAGYATGPHLHLALWAWDQSLYQPIPLGPLTEFERGLTIPAARRDGCAVYRR